MLIIFVKAIETKINKLHHPEPVYNFQSHFASLNAKRNCRFHIITSQRYFIVNGYFAFYIVIALHLFKHYMKAWQWKSFLAPFLLISWPKKNLNFNYIQDTPLIFFMGHKEIMIKTRDFQYAIIYTPFNKHSKYPVVSIVHQQNHHTNIKSLPNPFFSRKMFQEVTYKQHSSLLLKEKVASLGLPISSLVENYDLLKVMHRNNINGLKIFQLTKES